MAMYLQRERDRDREKERGIATLRQTRHTETELNCWQRERLWGGAVTSGEVDVCALDDQRMFAEQDIVIVRLVLDI